MLSFNRLLTPLFLLVTCTACAPPTELVVNSHDNAGDNNPGDGFCRSVIDSTECTLQAAFDEANGLPLEANVAIRFSAPGVYEFEPLTDDGLVINPGRRVTLTGATGLASATTIQPDLTNIGQSRIITLRGASLEIRNLTLRGGYFLLPPYASRVGGAILAEDGAYFLQLENCIVEDNQAKAGAGIFADQDVWGRVLIFDSVIRDNTAFKNAVGGAGGLHSFAGYVGIADSLFQNNIGESGALVIAGDGDEHAISGSTFYANEGRFGGAIAAVLGQGELRISRSTISNNTTNYLAGGLYIVDGTVKLRHTTLVENQASDEGSGIYVGNSGTLDIKTSLVDNNTGGGDGIECVGGVADTNGHNVLEDVDEDCGLGFAFFDVVADYIPSHFGNYEPDPIGHHPLYATSPAIDLGNDYLNGCNGVDQIGAAVPFDGDNDQQAKCDAGAVELHLEASPGSGGKLPEATLAVSSDRNSDHNPERLLDKASIKADMLWQALKPAQALADSHKIAQPEPRHDASTGTASAVKTSR